MARNKMYLYGKNSVMERLKANPKSISKVYIQDNFKSPDIIEMIKSRKIPIVKVDEKGLLKIKRADRLQGIVAETPNYTYASFEKLLDDSKADPISFIFLDGLNDPHNLGSIMRIAACFGGFAIVIPDHGACGMTEAVLHVSSGGENFVPVAKVTNLSTSLLKAKKAGYWAVGTVVDEAEDINSVALPFPICLVLGAEGKGIRYGIQKHLDMKVRLPMKGAELSFNVAMATAIFAHEINKQRGSA